MCTLSLIQLGRNVSQSFLIGFRSLSLVALSSSDLVLEFSIDIFFNVPLAPAPMMIRRRKSRKKSKMLPECLKFFWRQSTLDVLRHSLGYFFFNHHLSHSQLLLSVMAGRQLNASFDRCWGGHQVFLDTFFFKYEILSKTFIGNIRTEKKINYRSLIHFKKKANESWTASFFFSQFSVIHKMSTIHSVVSHSLVFSTNLSFSSLYNKINCLPFWTLLCFIFPYLSLSELTLFLLLRFFSTLRHHSLVHKYTYLHFIYAPTTTTSNFDVLKIQRKRATHGFPFCSSQNPLSWWE